MTRFPVTSLRSVDLGTPAIDRAERFYTSVWGLEVVIRDQGSVYLRATGSDHHVVALHASARPELRAVTFRLDWPTILRHSASMSLSKAGRCCRRLARMLGQMEAPS